MEFNLVNDKEQVVGCLGGHGIKINYGMVLHLMACVLSGIKVLYMSSHSFLAVWPVLKYTIVWYYPQFGTQSTTQL